MVFGFSTHTPPPLNFLSGSLPAALLPVFFFAYIFLKKTNKPPPKTPNPGRFCLERKACSRDERVSWSKVRQGDGKSGLTSVRIGTMEWTGLMFTPSNYCNSFSLNTCWIKIRSVLTPDEKRRDFSTKSCEVGLPSWFAFPSYSTEKAVMHTYISTSLSKAISHSIVHFSLLLLVHFTNNFHTVFQLCVKTVLL